MAQEDYGVSDFQPVIEWVEDQDNEPLDRQFGPTGADPFGYGKERTSSRCTSGVDRK